MAIMIMIKMMIRMIMVMIKKTHTLLTSLCLCSFSLKYVFLSVSLLTSLCLSLDLFVLLFVCLCLKSLTFSVRLSVSRQYSFISPLLNSLSPNFLSALLSIHQSVCLPVDLYFYSSRPLNLYLSPYLSPSTNICPDQTISVYYFIHLLSNPSICPMRAVYFSPISNVTG